jgi:acetyl-CoA synthetase
LDRHAIKTPDAVAILWEGQTKEEVRKVTYKEALAMTCRIANALKQAGVKKGDKVCLYLPMVPEAALAMLACARIGAPHVVVFAGFSEQSLADRILDTGAKVVITADEGLRGEKIVPLKATVNKALAQCPHVTNCFVLQRTGNDVHMEEGRDEYLHDVMARERSYCPPEPMDSEDPLFYLHTSGSTGKPKGLVHTTGGYLVYASLTHKIIFDYKPGDIYACMADIGWITGHTYIVYGPLCNGATTFMFEGVPTYPAVDRYWDMVARHKITQFYTAPTALRALMTAGDEPALKHDLSSLRILGSVGEPINPEAWRWYYNVIGKGKCAIVDTYWQTETGGIIMSPLPGATNMKPGAGCKPFFGVDLAVLDEKGNELLGNNVTGGLAVRNPWPGMARSIFRDHKRYAETYLDIMPGFYFTGDRCIRDKDGWYWVVGRMDDVMNVSGHRIGSAEVEGALVEHPSIAEAAVVAIPHEVKGQALVAYVTPVNGVEASDQLMKELKEAVKKAIGSFASPEMIVVSNDLPKTKSGKIMRRLLRKVAEGETEGLGDLSTLTDPGSVTRLIAQVAALRKPHAMQ